MFQLSTLLPLLVFIFTSYLFNKTKLEKEKSFIWMISLFEAFISYLIVYLIFFTNFLTGIFPFFLLILLLIGVSYSLFLIEKDLDKDLDLQIETIKNNLILYVLTFAPFYLLLTIFRFQGPFLQTLYSLLIVLVLVFSYFLLRRKVDQFLQAIQTNLFDTTERTIAFVGGSILFLILFTFLFNLPIEGIKQDFNLLDNRPYLSTDRLPIDLDNNFKRDTLFELTFEEEFEEELLDFYYYEGTLYLYTNNTLYSIDPSSGEIIYSESGFLRDYSVDPFQKQDLFFTQEDQLYFLNNNMVYQLSENTYDLMDVSMVEESQVFRHNGQIHLLHKIDENNYDIRVLSGDSFSYLESVDLTSIEEGYTLDIIGDTLFYKNDQVYEAYFNAEKVFTRIGEQPAYDALNEIMYSTTFDEVSVSTIYYQTKGEFLIEEYERNFEQNTLGFAHQGLIYYYAALDEEAEHLDIMNKDFTFQAIHSIFEYKPFWIGNTYNTTRIVDFQTSEEGISYLQVDKNEKELLLSYHTLVQAKTGLDLPFYAHYGLWVLIPTILGYLIPISNYRKSISIIGFDETIKKKTK